MRSRLASLTRLPAPTIRVRTPARAMATARPRVPPGKGTSRTRLPDRAEALPDPPMGMETAPRAITQVRVDTDGLTFAARVIRTVLPVSVC